MIGVTPRSTLFPYTTLFRSGPFCFNEFPASSPLNYFRIGVSCPSGEKAGARGTEGDGIRSEEHTSELQSHSDLVCRLLLETKKRSSASGALLSGSTLRRQWS